MADLTIEDKAIDALYRRAIKYLSRSEKLNRLLREALGKVDDEDWNNRVRETLDKIEKGIL